MNLEQFTSDLKNEILELRSWQDTNPDAPDIVKIAIRNYSSDLCRVVEYMSPDIKKINVPMEEKNEMKTKHWFNQTVNTVKTMITKVVPKKDGLQMDVILQFAFLALSLWVIVSNSTTAQTLFKSVMTSGSTAINNLFGQIGSF